MKNNTRSRIIVEMNRIDHASKIFDFMGRVQGAGSMGGDLKLICKGAVDCSVLIGHDVEILGVKHEFGAVEKIEEKIRR